MKSIQSGLLCLCLWSVAYGQSAPAQAPAQTDPASTDAPQPQNAPATVAGQVAPPPLSSVRPAPPFDDGVNTGDGISVEARYFYRPQGHPVLRGGQANNLNVPGDFVLPGWPEYGLGGVISVPAGKGAEIRVYGFQIKGTGKSVLGADRNFFGVGFPAGSAVQSRYTTQDVKVAYEYTTYPFTGRFRFKTLYEIQYVHIVPDIWIPQTFDGTQTPVDTLTSARHIIYPSFGVALEESVSKHLRLTAKTSGFAYPHHAVIWDADANAAVRIGSVEVVVGAMAYHFKTTPLKDFYLRETITAGYVGLRWYLFK